MKKIPFSYKEVKLGESFKKGDQYKDYAGKWTNLGTGYDGKKNTYSHDTFRRPIYKKKIG